MSIMLLRSGTLVVCLAASLPAVVVRVEVLERSDVLAGKSYGRTGPYEKIAGRVYFAVDPKLPANRIIADIDNAPRNDRGLVEFSSDLMVLKPRDPSHGNGSVLLEVNNRGGKTLLSMFNVGTSSRNPVNADEFGDGFLFERGYTLVWVGWQFDVPRNADLMRVYPPVATDHGRTITGPVRAEWVTDKREFSHSLGDRSHIPYAPVDPNDPALQLTVRDKVLGKRIVIPRNRWRIVEGTHVSMESGFDPGRLYEIVYTAKNPALVGLGPTAMRDFISFLKYGDDQAITALSDQKRYLKRAYAFGSSQSGRFQRTFLYYGFNADEKDRPVFDGMIVHVAGAGRGSFNHRFAQPSRDGHPFLNTLYPTDIFPFTDKPQTDPETGDNEGLLDRARQHKAVPKIFYTNSSYEYWGRCASLIHTSVDGTSDVEPPANTRIYLFAGSQHGPAPFPPKKGDTQHQPNFNLFTASMRAMLSNMDRWVAEGVPAPPSVYPKISDGTLVSPRAVRWPRIPGMPIATIPKKAYRVDFGPQFQTTGIVSIEPPKVGKEFPTMVSQVDSDGNETSGIRTPAIAAPLGTYAGWNLRSPSIGAPEELFSMQGSFVPFARTRQDRLKLKDPRPSIEERYPNRADYAAKVASAARALVDKGYLLNIDVPRLTARSLALWDSLMQNR